MGAVLLMIRVHPPHFHPTQQSCQYCGIMRRIPGKGGIPCKILFSLFIHLIGYHTYIHSQLTAHPFTLTAPTPLHEGVPHSYCLDDSTINRLHLDWRIYRNFQVCRFNVLMAHSVDWGAIAAASTGDSWT
jgi:hypothetical protein